MHTELAGLSWDLVSDFEQLTAYPFMVQALEAGTIVAVMAGAIGWFMVLRRQAFAGHTLSVIAFPGAAGATLAGLPVAIGYFGACGLGALALSLVSRGDRGGGGQLSSESAAIGTVQAFGLGLGFLFVSVYGGQLLGLQSLLFGTFLGITAAQVQTLLWIAAGDAGGARRRRPAAALRLGRRRGRPRRRGADRGALARLPARPRRWRWRRPRRSPARCSSSPCW